jgi:hypothetical protein
MSYADDVALARSLERCEVPNGEFRHASHLRVALVYLNESASAGHAIDTMAATLRRFAASVGHPEKYSQAVTEFWMYQMAAAHAVLPAADGEALLAAFPWLLDRKLPRAA